MMLYATNLEISDQICYRASMYHQVDYGSQTAIVAFYVGVEEGYDDVIICGPRSSETKLENYTKQP